MTPAQNLINLLRYLGLYEGSKLTELEENRCIQSYALALGNPDLRIGKYQPALLIPVLQNLGNEKVISPSYFTPSKLDLKKTQFPSGLKPDSSSLQQHLTRFKDALLKASGDVEKSWVAVEQYGTTIAIHSAYPDISVADAVRVATAYAVCLEKNGGKADFRLIGASVSGIQTYLYDIISKNAAKLLKGRSFYVQLLTDSLVQKIITTLGLTPLNVIYASGGGCYLLVPNNPLLLSAFEALSKQAAEMLYKEHGTLLFVDFAKSASFDENSNYIDALWDDLLNALNKARHKRLAVNVQLRSEFLEFIEYGGTTDKDPITNIEFKKDSVRKKLADGETWVLQSTWEQIELGKILRETSTIVRTDLKVNSAADKVFSDPFGYQHHFFRNEVTQVGFKAESIRTLNKPEGATATMLYGGNDFPEFKRDEIFNGDLYRKGDPKPFDYLAEGTDFDRLGVLRMDVDNLGMLFCEGIDKNISYPQNFARYAAVSRSLDWFFKGYLNTYWEEKYKDSTIIIYSGGDDLFIVGRWNDALNFGRDIREEFKSWVCCNPHLTISGGLAIVTGKFPLMQAAKDAKAAEEGAKKHFYLGKGKNAFCLFDVPLAWDTEMKIVEELKTEIYNLLNRGDITKSFLTKISTHVVAKVEQEKKSATLKWRWTMAWDLSRYRDSNAAKSGVAKEFVEQVMKDAFTNSYKNKKIDGKYDYLDLIYVAVRWAELEHRTL